MRPAPAHIPDVSGACRCRVPLGFWPRVMLRECLTITSAAAVRERKRVVFSDTGFGISPTQSLVLDRLCSAACAAVRFPGWDVSHGRAICKRLLQRKGTFISDAEGTRNYQRNACQTLPMKNFFPDKPGASSSLWWSREVSAEPGSSPLRSSQPGKSNPQSTVSPSCSGPAEACKDCGISSRGVPGVPYQI